jgi:hypothetical protein
VPVAISTPHAAGTSSNSIDPALASANQEDNDYRIDNMLLAEADIIPMPITTDNGQADYEFRTIDDMLLALETDAMIGTAPQRQGDNSTQVAEIPRSAASVPAAMAPAAVPGAKKRGRPKGSKDKAPRTRRKLANGGH